MSTESITHKKLTISAVDATPMDGKTDGRLYTDYNDDHVINIGKGGGFAANFDNASIIGSGAGVPDAAAVFNMFGVPDDFSDDQKSPAEFIGQVTFTLGTAVAGPGQRFFDSIAITDEHHPLTIGFEDVGNNRICRIVLDDIGYGKLIFEPITFTGLSDISFIVREFGKK